MALITLVWRYNFVLIEYVFKVLPCFHSLILFNYRIFVRAKFIHEAHVKLLALIILQFHMKITRKMKDFSQEVKVIAMYKL